MKKEKQNNITRRIQKVNQLLKKEIGRIIKKEISISEVLITLTRADTSPNLIQSKIYISVMPEKAEKKVFDLLNENIYDIQQQLNKRLNMRPVPRIQFEKEKQTKEAAKIEKILEDIKKEE